MKDDVVIRDQVPKKRRQLEAAPDVELAVWLDRDDLTPSERRRVQDEKDRRKITAPPVIGLLIGHEGLTPQQLAWFKDRTLNVDRIYHPGVSHATHSHCLKATKNVTVCEGTNRTFVLKEVVKLSDWLIAFPKEPSEPHQKAGTGVWEAVKYAKHRNTPVTIVKPNGEPIQ